ncbi:c-type cytochrome [Burkholderia contaminans]|nr:c-type cytochrome [Burkholderia contaminans]
MTVTLRSTAVLAVLCGLLSQPAFSREPQTERAPDSMEARVLACAACHGRQGEGTSDDYFPRLSGKPAGYLYNQLVAFRDGRRKYPPMNYLLAYLPDAYLHRIADHFASQRPPFPAIAVPTFAPAVLERGQQLVKSGDPARKIPACVSCHGAALTGMEPAVPGLLGLHANYLSAQLGAWRYGTRTSIAPDCMQEVASRLTDTDVTAISAWLASRPAPASPSPAPVGSLVMPLACGSEPR